jgi:hypothetical protein
MTVMSVADGLPCLPAGFYNGLGMIPSGGLSPVRTASRLESLREKPIFDFFPALCELQPEIAELHFATYRRRPGLSERLRERLEPKDHDLRESAEQLSAQGIEFWDAVLSLALERGTLRESFVEAAILHNFNLPERGFVLSREQVLNHGIAELVPALGAGEGLLVRSELRLESGKTALLPMLDFTCPCRGENARAIRKLVKLAGSPAGVLVRSGRSYHFYGVTLFSEKEWTRFLALSLLFAPITDSRYVAHRLLDGECRLKIVDSDGGSIPVIEEAFADEG